MDQHWCHEIAAFVSEPVYVRYKQQLFEGKIHTHTIEIASLPHCLVCVSTPQVHNGRFSVYHYCQSQEVPQFLHKLTNLSILNISGNVEINELPANMGLLYRLWNLNTSGMTIYLYILIYLNMYTLLFTYKTLLIYILFFVESEHKRMLIAGLPQSDD